MLRLARNCLLAILIACGASLVLAFCGLILAILPWLRAPDVPRAAVYPVLLIVFGKSAEVATLLGIPVGLALAASVHLRSEAMANGASRRVSNSRWRVTLALTCALGAIVGVFTLACINYWSLSPGRMAQSALTSAKERCLAEPGAPGVAIPIIGATWSCEKSRLPRLEGPLPGSNHRAWFSASDVKVSDDLLTVNLDDVRVGMRQSGQFPQMRLRTPHASVHGVRAVFRPAHLGPWLRALLGVGTGFLLGGIAAYHVFSKRWMRPTSAWALSGPSACCACAVLLVIDIRATGALLAYLWVPLSGLLALFAARAAIVHDRRKSAARS